MGPDIPEFSTNTVPWEPTFLKPLSVGQKRWSPHIQVFLLCPKNPALSLVQAWESLEEAEYQRELALRNELIRQEKLEQLARRFDRKAAMRETWLNENQRLVAQVTEDTRPEPPAVSWAGAHAGASMVMDKPLQGLAALLPTIGWIEIHL